MILVVDGFFFSRFLLSARGRTVLREATIYFKRFSSLDLLCTVLLLNANMHIGSGKVINIELSNRKCSFGK